MSPVPLDPQRGSYWYQAQDLEALRTHLGLEQLVIVAHSAGTRLAIAYASQYPDLVARMILITPPADYLVSVEPDDEEIRARRLGEPIYEDAAAMTLDTYAELFDDDLDAVASALDQARAASNVASRQSEHSIEAKKPRKSGLFASFSERSRWDLNSSFQITWQPLGSFWRRFAGMSRHPDDDASRENVANCCHFVAADDGRACAPDLLIHSEGIDGGTGGI